MSRGRHKDPMDGAYTYRFQFEQHFGPGPHTCTFCPDQLMLAEGVVHHKDHDHWNHDPDNLGLAHKPCHDGHHAKDRMASGHLEKLELSRNTPEVRAKQSESQKRFAADPQERKRRSERATAQWAARRAAGEKSL